MDWKEIVWDGVDWIHLAHDRDLLLASVNTIEGEEFLDKLSVCRFLKDSTSWL
jgi:hypothetical protein